MLILIFQAINRFKGLGEEFNMKSRAFLSRHLGTSLTRRSQRDYAEQWKKRITFVVKTIIVKYIKSGL